jgi:beta-glucuronidase
MLYPQNNSSRSIHSLDGFWRFVKDDHNNGEQHGWPAGIPYDREIAVPASWNEQYQDLMQFFETGWYEREFEIAKSWQDLRVWLRIGAANYYTKVWVNGAYVGDHEGAHLPFEFEISEHLHVDQMNKIVISVYVKIKPDSLPPGEVEHEHIIQLNGERGQFPRNYYDFFPYGGINRSVSLYTTADTRIEDITINTDFAQNTGIIHYSVRLNKSFTGQLTTGVKGSSHQIQMNQETTVVGQLAIEHVRLWSMDDPYLYDLHVSLAQNDQVIDIYTLPVGVRTIKVTETQLLLNDEPIFLKGVGMHEDFPVLGKGVHHAVIAKDMNLIKWLGGNSFRTSHYPYNEEFLNYADRNGILVIAETPFVGFVESHYNEEILAKAKRVISELIHRDKNHPSVIAWSLANEGNTFVPSADGFYKGMYDHAKSLDASRPITIVNCLDVKGDVALQHYDFVCINRYYGWYELPGLLDEACDILNAQLEQCYAQFRKPVMITEFGADAIAGMHMDPPELFSEEYQAEMITRQYEIIRSKPYTIGAHVWALSDFKTSQSSKRVILNRKGLFTRERQPKLAAHRIREQWT